AGFAPAALREAPPLTLRDAGGKEGSLTDCRGKVGLVQVWGVDCVPWLKELAHRAQVAGGVAPAGVGARAHVVRAGARTRRGGGGWRRGGRGGGGGGKGRRGWRSPCPRTRWPGIATTCNRFRRATRSTAAAGCSAAPPVRSTGIVPRCGSCCEPVSGRRIDPG